MTVFSVQAQASTVELILAYFTEVHRSDNGTEQRQMYRDIPSRRLRFLAKSVEAWTSGWLDALTYGAHGDLLTVPYWPHAVRLTAQATAGAAVALAIDPTDRDFVVGGRLVLWSDERTTEECTISAVGVSTVTVETLVSTWPIGTFVMPAWRGKQLSSMESSKIAPFGAEMDVDFAMETDADDPGVTESTTALVFTIVPVNRVEVTHTYENLLDVVESPFYDYQSYKRRLYPIGARPYVLWLESRAEIAELIEWFHGLRGRLRSFWMPTFQQDFEVLSGLGTSTLVIKHCGYADRLFGDYARRHLICFTPDGTGTALDVLNAVDNGDGTESLTLTGNAPSTTQLVSYLLYGRLEDDALRVKWYNTEQAECAIGFLELPQEITPGALEPLVGALTLTGLAPEVLIGSTNPVNVAPGTGELALLGYQVAVSTNMPAPGVGELELEGLAPTVFTGLTIAPGVGIMTLEGLAPSLPIVPSTGELTLVGRRPRIRTN
jgi:hypothetical protein